MGSNVLSARGPIAEMRLVVLITMVTVDTVVGLMVKDEDSCHGVEEQNCGLCHTIYIQQCGLKMVEEMLPTQGNICRNITRFFHSCTTEMKKEMVEDERPLCTVNKAECDNCKQVMSCKIEKTMKQKFEPNTICQDIPRDIEKECVDMVKLRKQERQVEQCWYEPKTVCKPTELKGSDCRNVKRTMCNYYDEIS